MSELLTIAEVAGRLRVSRRTVERLIEGGKLRALQVSKGRRVVEAKEVEAYIAAARRAA